MNKLNWPTAFVIVAIIFAGAFLAALCAAFNCNKLYANFATMYLSYSNIWSEYYVLIYDAN